MSADDLIKEQILSFMNANYPCMCKDSDCPMNSFEVEMMYEDFILPALSRAYEAGMLGEADVYYDELKELEERTIYYDDRGQGSGDQDEDLPGDISEG